ncbi:MCE family protein [Nocardioides sp. cx-169]|uniref:MCE family protein n=1 Tax=Nocardioides sp. cx-169 TaxID=2899080 RepID=UPI001E3C7F22|nr:MCE family protein [Nocardioides sp. cx-169]MCD4533584.1 MCE family protein [Nocardioides sp. cx-169]
MTALKKYLVPLVVLVLVAAAVLAMTGGDDQKRLVAHFPRTISVYEGSEVRVLGVPIGRVESVKPSGTDVEVTMAYDAKVKVPADARAVIVAPSIVGDRYIQLTPVYTEGEVLADDSVLEGERTAVPLELDQIYSSLDRLTVALGPDGANAQGSLSDLLEVTAENFGGQGEQLNQTIEDFSTLTSTLDNNKEELFGSAERLGNFIETLADNDATVQSFNSSLSSVSTMLSGERQELAASLRNLSVALGEVGTFVRDNRTVLGRNIKKVNRVAKVLVKQRAALDETLKLAPLALNNLALTYNPDAGTLDTNANIGNLVHEITNNPTLLLCSLIGEADPDGELCDLIEGLPLPRNAPFGAGTGTGYGAAFDPTLGGLVKVDQ